MTRLHKSERILAFLIYLFVGLQLLSRTSSLVFADDAAVANVERTRVFLIGDSTVKNGSGEGQGGLWGWGQLLDRYLDQHTAIVENRAVGGRSSRSYLTEGLWDKTREQIRPGDFVLIQFGHNDGGDMFAGDRPRASLKGNSDDTVEGVIEKTGEHEVVHSYGWYLRRYVTDTLAKGAFPIVCSPVPRNRWKDGQVLRANDDYGKWARQAAEQMDIPFLDLNEMIAVRYETLGAEKVGIDLFTEKDWTHTTKAGAELNAAVVAQGLQSLGNDSLNRLLRK